ncbi:hypothetical protein [uncultured Bacteroides sp.]|uniref:hypothetical protein n=1 Tax=uncultured Bacteroides sp. TaxID=162156 RepID=UPI0025F24DEE|nr:hypothetical protein [uncultured Bacteroides sp.]
MKQKLLFYVLPAIVISLSSCQERWEDNKPTEAHPIILTYDQERDVVNNYTEIDTVNNLYSVIITDSIMQAEHLTDANVERILKDIARANKNIKEDIKAGTTTTLTLCNNKGFKSYTINESPTISIKDEYILASQMRAETRANSWGMSFNAGSWYDSSITFDASDHVTSEFYVNSCTGYWKVNLTCKTGTSTYGTNFSTYGTRYTSGGIKRFWWTTVGGTAPFRWSFITYAPVGGEANGGITFTNTY